MNARFKLFGVCLLAAFAFVQAAEAEEGGSQALQFLEKTELHGTVDATYNYNYDRPAANALRAFDTDANSISLNLVELAVQHQANDWAQFRFDLDFGRDARVFQAAGFADGDNFELQQGYAYLKATSIGNGLGFKIGKYVTMHGAEVIESASNVNTSRSLLFTWAIPFTHTGVIADYTFNDYFSLAAGVVNGWDNVTDNNQGKTGHAMLTLAPLPGELTLYLGGTFGPEQAGSDGNYRALVDANLVWNALDNLTLTLNSDLGKEDNVGGSGFANWWGFAGYAHWKATDLFGLSLRGEYFDEDISTLTLVGVRTGTLGDKLMEGTLTSHLYLLEGFDLRFEYRLDRADQTIFADVNGNTSQYQHTALAEAVYAF